MYLHKQCTTSAVKSNPSLQGRRWVHSYISEVACFRTGALTSLSELGLLRRAEIDLLLLQPELCYTSAFSHTQQTCIGLHFSWYSHYGFQFRAFTGLLSMWMTGSLILMLFFFFALFIFCWFVCPYWRHLSYYIIFLMNEWKSSHSIVNTVNS